MKCLRNTFKMGCIVYLFLFCVGTPLLAKQAPDANASIQFTSEANLIDPNLAIFVAEDYLPAFYPGDWEFFYHLVCYDLDGMPAAYLIVFRDPNSNIKTWEEVTTQVEKASNKLDELDSQIRIIKASKQTPQEDKERLIKERKAQRTSTLRKSYLSGDFATVVTGATEESTPLIRCYRGLPEIFVTKIDLERELKTEKHKEKLKLRHILYLDPLDFRYEVVSGSDKEKTVSAGTNVVRQSLADESYMISQKEKHLVRISTQKQKLRDRIKQKGEMLVQMNDEQQKNLEQAEEAKKTHRVSQWAEFRNQHQEYLKQQKMEGGREK